MGGGEKLGDHVKAVFKFAFLMPRGEWAGEDRKKGGPSETEMLLGDSDRIAFGVELFFAFTICRNERWDPQASPLDRTGDLFSCVSSNYCIIPISLFSIY